jgi:hypothetical protein
MNSCRLLISSRLLTALFVAFLLTGCAAKYGQVILEDDRGTISVEVEEGGEYGRIYPGEAHRYYKTTLPEIPPGHMPPPGKCRIWIPGKTPGQQPPPGDCYELEMNMPPGAWLIRG